MTISTNDIPALAQDLVNVDGLFDRRDGELGLALYRLLAEGTFLLTIEGGLELGRLINRALFGAALEGLAHE
jgi:hypothetical protein